MGITRVDMNISLDGYATTVDQTPDDPFGQDWGRLVAAYSATRTFRERVLGDTDKVIVDEKAGSGVVPYLPLSEFTKKAPAQAPAEESQQ